MGPATDPFSPFENQLLTFGTIAFLIGAAVEVGFLVHYIVVAPAFKSWIGWMFVIRSFSFLLSGLAILLGRFLGPTYGARPYVTLVLYIFVMLSAFVTYGTFLRERGRGRVARGSGGPLRFARRALGIRTARDRQDPADSTDAEPRLHLVEDRPA